MVVDLPLLGFALLCLWLPRRWMRFGVAFLRKRKRRGERFSANQPWHSREPGDPRLHFRREFAHGRNYIDFGRAAAGALLIDGGLGVEPCMRLAADAAPDAATQLLALQVAIFAIGVLIQTVRVERGRLSFYPPIFYLAGLTVGLCDLRSAAFAFALIWAVNVVLGNAQAFLTVYALLILVFGFFFAQHGRAAVVIAGGLCFTPVILSLLSRRPLAVMSRKAVHG